MKKIKPIALTIKPTNACNFQCKHCFNGEHLKEKDFLPIETVFKALELISKKYNDIKITFHGGEPTLVGIDFYKNIFSYEKMLKKKYDVNFWHLFQTNGYLLNSEFIDLLISEGVFISISFDGPHNNDLRSKSDIILKRINEIKEKNGKLRIFCVETAKSIEYLFDTYNWFKENKLNYKILPIQPRGFAENKKEFILNPKIYINNLLKVYTFWLKDKGNSTNMYTFQEFLKLKKDSKFKEKWFDKKLSLNSDGNFYPFGRPYDINFNLGNPYNLNNIDECFLNKNYIELKDILNNKIKEKCQKCNVFQTCNGNCLCSSFVYGNDENMLDYSCELARLTFENVIKINEKVKRDILKNGNQLYNDKVVKEFAF